MMKRIIKMMAIIPAIAVFAMVLAGCNEDTPDPIRATKVTVNPSTLDLVVGASSSPLSATVEPSNTVDNTVTWTSNNPGIAEVSSTGVVTGKSGGTTKIIATTPNQQAGYCEVTVHVPLTGITLSTTEVTLDIEGSEKITVTPVPANATDLAYVWTVTPAEGVVSYTTDSASITLTGTGGGSAVVTVTYGTTISETVNVTVNALPLTADDVLQSAVAYWEFEDDADLGKPTYGTSSLTCESSLTRTEGPSANNKAVIGELQKQDISWTHPWFEAGTPPDLYTVMWDLKLPRERKYYGGLWCGHNANVLLYRWRDDRIQVGSGKMDDPEYIGSTETYPAGTEEYTPWIRLIAVIDRGPSSAIEGKEVRRLTVYFDGATGVDIKTSEPIVSITVDDLRFDILAGFKLWFLSDSEEEESARNDDNPHPLSAIAFWDKALTVEEITALGGVQ